MKRILSIDGGGIKGIIPAYILAYMEKRLKEKTDNHNARLVDHFDLVAGTSTGGILTCLLLAPDEHGRPRFSASEALQFYFDHALDIFSKRRPLSELHDARWSNEPFERIANAVFGNKTISEFVKPCLLTSFNLKTGTEVMYTSHNALSTGRNPMIRQAAMRTSAAPTYFRSSDDEVDGGIACMGNPALPARTEMFKMNGFQYDEKDVFMLSIATGNDQTRYDFRGLHKAGVVKWAPTAIDIALSSSSRLTDYHLRQMYTRFPDNYARFSPALGGASTHMDEASIDNQGRLRNAGERFVQANEQWIEKILDEKLILNAFA